MRCKHAHRLGYRRLFSGNWPSSTNRLTFPRPRRLALEPLEDRRMLSIMLFVDVDAAPGGDGLAWGSAYDDLQSALDQAEVLNTDGDTTNDVEAVWIAEGTYEPSALLESGDARSASFSLLDGVTLYGGFAGTETTLDARDWLTHVTTLSGDLGTPDDNSWDNAYTIVYCGQNIEAGIDGVSITAGNANGYWGSSHPERQGGGGIYNSGTLTVTNSTLSANSASSGGGISNYGGTLTVMNSTRRMFRLSTGRRFELRCLSWKHRGNIELKSARRCPTGKGTNSTRIRTSLAVKCRTTGLNTPGSSTPARLRSSHIFLRREASTV